MNPDPTSTENIFLLDDLDLFREIGKLTGSSDSAAQVGCNVLPLPSEGTGFTKSRRFQINNADFNFLLISPENAHPFTYLTVGQRTMKRHVPLIVTVAQAQSLRRDLHPGDIALVSEAVALPYPALYQNKDPQNPTQIQPEIYPANPNAVTAFTDFAQRYTLPQIWQKSLPVVRSGYTKHPTRNGAIQPWAREQFEQIKQSGIDTIAQTPAGVYEAQHLCPNTEIICFNMIKGIIDQPENPEWNRHKTKLLYPAIRLLVDIVSIRKDAGVHK